MYECFKYALLVIVFISSSMAGVKFAANAKESLKINEGILSLILHIRRSVEYYTETLDKVYETFDNEALEEIGFLPSVLKLNNDGEVFPFCNALELYKKRLSLDEDVYSALYSFGKTLGNCCSGEQIDSCTAVAEFLEEKCSCMRRDLPKKIKLRTTLGVSCGMMIVIVLI